MISTTEYKTIRGDILDALLAPILGGSLPSGIKPHLYELIISEIFGEIDKIISTAIEVSRAKQRALNLEYCSTAAPLIHFFDKNDRSAGALTDYTTSRYKRYWTFRRAAKKSILFFRSHALLPSSNKFLLNSNHLLQESDICMARRLPVLWADAILPAPRSGRGTGEDWEFARELAEVILGKTCGSETSLPNVSRKLILRLISGEIAHWVGRVRHDAEAVAKKSLVLGQAIYSGAPKYEGRLLSYVLMQNGGSVTRFEHGGERPFFIDPLWRFSELLFCTRYHCFSRFGADALSQSYLTADDGVSAVLPKFYGQGSKYHQQIAKESSRRTTGVHQSDEVLFVPGLYLGEQYRKGAGHLEKLHDIPALQFQARLIEWVKASGYKVIVKAHPGGLNSIGDFLLEMGDGATQARYSPLDYRTYAQIFDWPGTAFISALATDAPVILFLPPGRSVSTNAFSLLQKRVVIREIPDNSDLESCMRGETPKHLIEEARMKADTWRPIAHKVFSSTDND